MTVKQGLSRAEAARRLGVSKPRVTQYVQQGMPTLGDGSIDLGQAQAWIRENLDPARRLGHVEAKQRRRDEAQTRGPFSLVRDFDQPAHRGFAYAAANAIYRAGFHAIYAAADAGVSRDQAEELAKTLQVLLWADLELHAEQLGMRATADDGGVLQLWSEVLDQQRRAALSSRMFDADGRSLVTGQSRSET